MADDKPLSELEMHFIQDTWSKLDLPQKEEIKREVNEIYYSRSACARLGMNYNTLPNGDALKAYRHVMKKLGHLPPK